jgi:NTP pyrophosphatase (non-canonical NTP hydrolase)
MDITNPNTGTPVTIVTDNRNNITALPYTSYTVSLNALRDRALATAVAHGFTDATIGEDLMLMVTEIAEAMEDHRAGKAPAEVWYEEKAGGGAILKHVEHAPGRKPCGIPSELADVLIRVFHFAGKHKIDLERAVLEKMDYNDRRDFRHGGKTV